MTNQEKEALLKRIYSLPTEWADGGGSYGKGGPVGSEDAAMLWPEDVIDAIIQFAEDNNVPTRQPDPITGLDTDTNVARKDPITGLVPCGCGGKAAVKKGVNHRSGYYVICEKCECNIGLDRDDYLRPYGAYPTEEQAVSDWDTAMGYTAPPRPGAIGPEPDGTAPIGDKGAEGA